MNIRVDLNTPIKDGTEVVFRSPVDCSQVTGLKVYYDGGNASQEFAFADAHGNNVGDIDHLFAENVAVKVILDVTTGMAFVQNADTNAYLEGRFKALAEAIAQMGGSGGTTIHFIDWLFGEVGPSDVNTKYKVGDLFFVTNEAEAGFYELTGFDTESEPGLIFPVWEAKYVFPQTPDTDTNGGIVWKGEWCGQLNEGYPIMVTYNGSLYFGDPNTFMEGVAPDVEGSGWVKLIGTTDYATNTTPGLVKVASGSGSCVAMDGGYLTTMRATEEHITNRGANYTDFLLKASHTNHIVKSALTDANRIVMTNEEKILAQKTLGVDTQTLVNSVIAALPVYDGSVV